MPMRNQMIREFHQQARETVSRSERIATRQTLRERIMAPAGPNGNISHNLFNQSNKINLDFDLYLFSMDQHLPLAKVRWPVVLLLV